MSTSMLFPGDLDQQKSNLSGFVAAMQQVNGFATTLQATNLPPDSASLSWYGSLHAHLQNLKAQANTWLNSLEPNLIATIRMIASYGQQFDQIANQMLQCLPNPTAAEQQQLLGDLVRLTALAQPLTNGFGSLQQQYTSFKQAFDADIAALSTDESNTQDAITDCHTQIQNLNNTIDNLQQEIGQLELKMLEAKLQGQPTDWYQEQIADCEQQIDEALYQISNLKNLISELTSLSQSLQPILQQDQQIAQSMSDVTNFWSDVSAKLGAESQTLRDAISDGAQGAWQDLQLDVQLAQQQWSDLSQFVNQLLPS